MKSAVKKLLALACDLGSLYCFTSEIPLLNAQKLPTSPGTDFALGEVYALDALQSAEIVRDLKEENFAGKKTIKKYGEISVRNRKIPIKFLTWHGIKEYGLPILALAGYGAWLTVLKKPGYENAALGDVRFTLGLSLQYLKQKIMYGI